MTNVKGFGGENTKKIEQSQSVMIDLSSLDESQNSPTKISIKPSETMSSLSSTKEFMRKKFYSQELKPNDDQNESENKKTFKVGCPAELYPPYVCSSTTMCHLLEVKENICCLQLNNNCEHRRLQNLHQQIATKKYNIDRRTIILAVPNSNLAIYNFIVPLRSNAIRLNSLNPILLLFETCPSQSFLEIIRCFPFVNWMKGSIDKLDDLLEAGINEAKYLIIVNKEKTVINAEQALEDSETILAVQYIFR
jgi:hypothetical protein